MKNLKVLISRKDLKDTTSGVPKKVLQEIRFFKERGDSAFAIAETMNHGLIKEFGGTPVKTLRWPVSGFLRRKFYQSQVNRWIRKHRPDIVVGHGDIEDQDILFIHNCVHLAHELIEKTPLPPGHEVGRIHERILRKGAFKLLICNSQMMKDDLVKRFKIPEEKAVVVYPEVNLSKFSVDDPVRVKTEWRRKLAIPEDEFVLGLVTSGNFRKRNLKTLIEAFHVLTQSHPKLRLFVAGGNIDQEFRTQVEGLGLSNRVTFAPAIIDVKNYYYLLDVFILPAFIEEFGRSVLEAMYCGKPVIATRTVGATEILEDTARELILETPNEESIVRLCEKILRDENLRNAIGILNNQTAIKYSADKQNDAFGETLKKFKIL